MRSIAVTACLSLLAFIVTVSMNVSPALGQARVQFQQPYPAAPPIAGPGQGVGGFGGRFGAPTFPNAPQPGAFLGSQIQPLDPYALPSNVPRNMPPAFGGNVPAPAPYSMTPPGYPSGYQAPPTFPPPGTSGGLPGGPISNLPPNGANVGAPFPGSSAPYGSPLPPPGGANTDPWFRGSPYAGGNNPATWPDGNPSNIGPANPYGNATNQPPYQRLFQDTGLRGTYLYGHEKDDLSMTEVEASTTAYFANFLGVPNGLRVTPGFDFLWTDGPQAPETSDVPARLYGGYIDLGLNPQFNPMLSAELTARAGIYTDFQSFNADSIRWLGSAVGVYQASPEVAVKLGAAYIDRVKYKLLPAAGILWTPNPQTRWDIFFPAPKLSNYWTTVGNQQVWWYLGGEYGGGSWSIEREDAPRKGENERIDINDIRVYVGMEWWNLNRFYGFAELGYVFDREIVYYRVPGDSIHVDDTFMARAGISW